MTEIPINGTPHRTSCSWCGEPLTVYADPDAPEDMVKRLLNITVCNYCADKRIRERDNIGQPVVKQTPKHWYMPDD